LGATEAYFRYSESESSASPGSAAPTNGTSARVFGSVLVDLGGEGEAEGDAGEISAGAAAAARPQLISGEKATFAERAAQKSCIVGTRVDTREWLRRPRRYSDWTK